MDPFTNNYERNLCEVNSEPEIELFSRKMMVFDTELNYGPPRAINNMLAAYYPHVGRVVFAPPSVYLMGLKEKFGSSVVLAGQNCSSQEEGPFTGEVSARMLKDVGCDWVIVGSRVRRELFGERSRDIWAKAKQAQLAGLGVIFCFGESSECPATWCERLRQCDEQLSGLEVVDTKRIVFAYQLPIQDAAVVKSITEEMPTKACFMFRMIRTMISICVNRFRPDLAKPKLLCGLGPQYYPLIKSLMDSDFLDGLLISGPICLDVGEMSKLFDKRLLSSYQ